MFTTSIIIALGSAILTILFGFILSRNVLKQSEGNKKIIDNVKLLSKEIKKDLGAKNTILAAVCGPVLVLVLYFLNWQIALGFAVGVLITILLNLFLANFVANSSGRVAESSRKDLPTAVNIAFKSGSSLSLILIGSALLVTVGFYSIFKNTEILIGLAGGISLVSLFLKFSSKTLKGSESDASSSIGFFELIVLSMVATMFLGNAMFKNSDNPTLLPIILTSASVIVFAITSVFIRLFKNTKKIVTIFYRSLAINTVLFAAGTFFIYNWMMKEIGVSSLINFYGLAIISIIVVFLVGYAILMDLYNKTIKCAIGICEKSEMAVETKNSLVEANIYEKISEKLLKLYNIKATIIVAVVAFASFRQILQKGGTVSAFDLGDYHVLIGLLLGVLVISLLYYQKIKFNFKNINQTIILSSIVVLVPVIIGLVLGSVALGAYVIGIIVSGLFVSLFCSKSFAKIITFSAVMALLIALYIK